MSSSVTQVDGTVVVTQDIPKGPGGEQAGPERRDPWPPGSPDHVPAKVSEMTAAFLRGQPQALGIMQIFVGLMCMISALIGFMSPIQMMHLPLFASVTFVVSGSVAVAAKKGTNINMIRATLGLHVLSAVVSLAGMFFLSWLLAEQPYVNTPPRWRLQSTLNGVWTVILFMMVLEFCVAVSLCVFAGRALSRSKPYISYMVAADTDHYSTASTVNLLDAAAMNEPTP